MPPLVDHKGANIAISTARELRSNQRQPVNAWNSAWHAIAGWKAVWRTPNEAAHACVQAIDMFAQLHKLPRSIHHRVRAYYDYLLRNAVHDLDSHIVTSLSPQLRQDVLLFLYSDLVAKVPFFRNKSQQFIAELIQKLRAEVFPPGEFVTVEVCPACCPPLAVATPLLRWRWAMPAVRDLSRGARLPSGAQHLPFCCSDLPDSSCHHLPCWAVFITATQRYAWLTTSLGCLAQMHAVCTRPGYANRTGDVLWSRVCVTRSLRQARQSDCSVGLPFWLL